MSSVEPDRLEDWRYVVLATWLGHAMIALGAIWWVGSDGALSQGTRYMLLGRLVGYYAPQIALLYACLFIAGSKKSSAAKKRLDPKRVYFAVGIVVVSHSMTLLWFLSDLWVGWSRLRLGVLPADNETIEATVNHYIAISGLVFSAFAAAPLKFLFPRN